MPTLIQQVQVRRENVSKLVRSVQQKQKLITGLTATSKLDFYDFEKWGDFDKWGNFSNWNKAD